MSELDFVNSLAQLKPAAMAYKVNALYTIQKVSEFWKQQQ